MSEVTDLEARDFLPGFEDIPVTREMVAEMTDADIDRRFPATTGSNLKSSNPRLYSVAARLFFEFGLSQREIAVMCKVSRSTIAAMVAAEQSAFEAKAQKRARLRRLRGLQEQSLTRLEGLLANSEACRKAGITGIAAAHKVIEEAADRLDVEINKDVLDYTEKRDTDSLENNKYLEM